MDANNTQPKTEEDCPYGSDRCTKLGNLRFRPQHRLGECGGCKGVCFECENLLLDEDEDDEPQHDICCGCGKYDDTRPVCDCGGSHRSNCAECENEDEDVCCVGCGERVCGFTEEPPHKDRKDEAVCDDCYDPDEDEDEAYEKRIEALGPPPSPSGDEPWGIIYEYHTCDRIILGDCVEPRWHREDKLRYNEEDLHLCPGCFDADPDNVERKYD